MGIVNLAVGRMMSQKEIFADYVNGTLYGGETVLLPEDLEMITTHRGITEEKDGRTKTMEFEGDIRMRADFGTYSVIFAEENQSHAHLAMPVRCMHYDALEYYEQWKEFKDVHAKEKDLHSSEELLSGIKREDKFKPVISSVLFTGKSWDGPTELYDMLDFGDGTDKEFWKQYIPNYKINLVNMAEFENPNVFHSCLQHIFSMVKYKDDKEKFQRYRQTHRSELEQMGEYGTDALVAILGESGRVAGKIAEYSKNKEESGVCRAIDELIADGKAEGKIEGKIEGKTEAKIELICKKLRKNKSVEVIADELEEGIEFVQSVVKVAEKFAPEYDFKAVCEAWNN